MNIDALIEKALEALKHPKADQKRVLLAFAETVGQKIRAAIPPGGRCSGCGAPSPLCGKCSVKQAIGGLALDALGFGNAPTLEEVEPRRAQRRQLRPRGRP